MSSKNYILLMSWWMGQFFILSTLDITSLKYFPVRWVKNGISLGVKFTFFMNMSETAYFHTACCSGRWQFILSFFSLSCYFLCILNIETWCYILQTFSLILCILVFYKYYRCFLFKLNINSFAVVICISHYIMLSIVLLIKRPSLTCNYKAFLYIFF